MQIERVLQKILSLKKIRAQKLTKTWMQTHGNCILCKHVRYDHLNVQGVHMFKSFTEGQRIQFFMHSFINKTDTTF
jgi:hypothetical protein